MTKKCQIKEGIVFAFHNREGKESLDEGTEGWHQTAFENYARERLKRRPEHRRLGIGLERLARSLAQIEGSWRHTSRHHAQKELENMLHRQHELESETENIEDVFLRGYIYELLDDIAAARRSLSEEVKWDIESEKKSKGVP